MLTRSGQYWPTTARLCRLLHPLVVNTGTSFPAPDASLSTSCLLQRARPEPGPVNATQHHLSKSMTIMATSKHDMAKRLEGTDKNVWVQFGKLAADHKALNLGQGFPDFYPPDYVRKALCEAIMSPDPLLNQYTRGYGHPRLVKALANTFSPIMGRDIDVNEEIVVTVGAYGSLFAAAQGLINPGDEAIIIEPYFDCYEPMVRVAGGTPVFVPLRPIRQDGDLSSDDWKLDPDELASKFNSKTKVIFVNNPNNPVGKVFKKEELELIADLCKKHDVVVLADEVYEWLIYAGNKHIKIATLPDMWDRTVTIGSAGKTFSVTGWKLGWAIGPKKLIHALQTVHQNCNYTCPTPIQEAVAVGFETELPQIGQPQCYYQSLPAELQPKRDMLAEKLREVGMIPTVPEGGYFMICDFSKLGLKFDSGEDGDTEDVRFVKWLTQNKKLAAIPPSAFYCADHKHLAKDLVRFCFCKEDATLQKAADILKEWSATL